MIYAGMSRWLALWSLLAVSMSAFSVHAQSGASLAASGVRLVAAETESVEAGNVGAAVQLDATDSYRLALLKMKGHLSVGRALLQIRIPGAAHHLGQPLQNQFRHIEAELDRRSAPFTADTLRELEHAMMGDPVTALAAVELAVLAIDGSFARTGAMDTKSVLALAEALLRGAVAKYTEAVTDNEVIDIPKYRSGRGFATEAEALVRYSSRLRGRSGHKELLAVVTLIRQAWPSVIPPGIVFDPPSVTERLDEAVAAMEKLR